MPREDYPQGEQEVQAGKEQPSSDTRSLLVQALKASKKDIELSDIPRCILAVNINSLKRGLIDIKSVDTDIKVSIGEQYGWIDKHVLEGFQLIFIFDVDADKWKLYDNATGLTESEIMETLTPADIQRLWEQSRLAGLDEEYGGNSDSPLAN